MLTALEAEQAQFVVRFCAAKQIPIVHIPNEGRRKHFLDATYGIRAGFPDFFVPVVKIPHGGLFIELKRDGNARVSPKQWEWIQKLNYQGYVATIAYGQDEAIKFIENYKNLHPDTWKWERFSNTLHKYPA